MKMSASAIFCPMSLLHMFLCSIFQSSLPPPHSQPKSYLLPKSLRKDRPHSDFPQQIVKSLTLWLFVQHIVPIFLRLILSVLEHH